MNERLDKTDFKLLFFRIATVSLRKQEHLFMLNVGGQGGEASEVLKVRNLRRHSLSGSYRCLLKFRTLDISLLSLWSRPS